MSDPRVEQLKLAMSGEQSGGGLDDIRVYMGSPKQSGQGLGGLLGPLARFGRFIAPIALKIGKKIFKSSSDALKDGNSLGDSFKSALKPALCTALKHGGKAHGKIIEQQEAPSAAPPIEPPLLHQDDRDVGTEKPPPQVGSGRYKATRKRKTHGPIKNSKRNIHYNF
jgi:hypothetical protein